MYEFLPRIRMGSLVAAVLMLAANGFGEENIRESPLVRAVRQASRSVVNIHTEKDAAATRDNRLFQQPNRKISGMGTGLVVDEAGYIVTNYHVIDGVSRITVTFYDGRASEATVVSFDRKEDLAVIHIDCSESLEVMPTGSSADLMLAETVFAVGNAFGYEHTVTSGIISALHRDVEVDEFQSYQNLIQTDASINPGNSGGPLLNVAGDVIGINVAIRSGAQRIGFAIPIDDARDVIARLLSVERLRGHTHGIHARRLPHSNGLTITSIRPDSPAAACGLQSGDTICRIGDLQIADATDLERAFLGVPTGSPVDVAIERSNQPLLCQLTLGRVGSEFAGMSIQPSRTQFVSASQSTSGSMKPAVSNALPPQEMFWNSPGVRVRELTPAELQTITGKSFPGANGDIRYNGGLRITAVRAGSAAAVLLRTDDILLGLDGYETVSIENFEFIMDPQRAAKSGEFRCQYLRPGENPVEGLISLD